MAITKHLMKWKWRIDAKIGCFVVDNFIELQMLNAIAAEKRQKVKIFAAYYAGC